MNNNKINQKIEKEIYLKNGFEEVYLEYDRENNITQITEIPVPHIKEIFVIKGDIQKAKDIWEVHGGYIGNADYTIITTRIIENNDYANEWNNRNWKDKTREHYEKEW